MRPAGVPYEERHDDDMGDEGGIGRGSHVHERTLPAFGPAISHHAGVLLALRPLSFAVRPPSLVMCLTPEAFGRVPTNTRCLPPSLDPPPHDVRPRASGESLGSSCAGRGVGAKARGSPNGGRLAFRRTTRPYNLCSRHTCCAAFPSSCARVLLRVSGGITSLTRVPWCGTIVYMAKTKPSPANNQAPELEAEKRQKFNKSSKESMKDVGRDPVTGNTIPHVYDERVATQVGFYVSAGMDPDEIARMLNIRPGKLKQLYGRELETGVNVANMKVAKAMHEAACAGDVSAGRFWLKARAGWKDGESAQQTTSPLQIHIHD